MFVKIGLMLLSATIALSACTQKRGAIGEDHKVSVVADSLLYAQLEPVLSTAIEKVVRTPWPEKVFVLNYTPPEKLHSAAVQYNILMLGLVDSTGGASKQVNSMLTDTMRVRVRQGKAYLFRKKAPWAEDQLLLVLASTDAQSLSQKIANNADYIYSLLRENSLNRTKESMFARYEQKELERTLLDKYDWTIRIQHDYVIFQEIPENNFVHLRRTSPERWLYVHWIETFDPSIVMDKEWLIRKRNEIGRMHYENDAVVDTFYTFYETDIGGRWALAFQGLWENVEKSAGGPLKVFAFYDEIQKRAYIIDIAVFAPGKRKEPYMRQLEIMARSFKTIHDMQSEEK